MMKKETTYIVVSIFGIALLIKVFQIFLFTPLISDAFHGEAFKYLNELLNQHRLKDPDNRTLQYYITSVASYTNRFLGVYLTASIFLFWLWRYRRKTIKVFFTKPTPAINLAIFRIAFFGYLLYLDFPQKAIAVSYLDPEAVVPPPGWHYILSFIPVEPVSIHFLSFVFELSCILGFIGLYTRTSILTAAVSGLWIMGVPEFFGKVDHYHFLWQFLLILGFSRSGDALSVDVLIRSIKYPFKQFQQKSTAYRLPLVFIWLTIGLIYFFPGLWKFVFSGFDWAFSENLKYKMYSVWLGVDDWTPFFRLDHYPLLYKSAALSVIIFEIGFIFALPIRISRIVFVWGGIIFHIMTRLFMRIGFTGLLVMYTSFIDWDKFFKKVGQLFLPINLYYNTENIYSIQIKRSIELVDVFNAVRFKKISAKNKITPFISTDDKYGFSPILFFQLVLKVPLILVASPLLVFVLFCSKLGIKTSHSEWHPKLQSSRSVVVIGLFVLALNLFTGAAIINSWPFSVYPTFASIETEYTSTILIAAYNESGKVKKETIPLVDSENSFTSYFKRTSRLRGFIRHILNSNKKNVADYNLLLSLWMNEDRELNSLDSVKFYQIQLSMDPDKEYEDYKVNKLLYEKDL